MPKGGDGIVVATGTLRWQRESQMSFRLPGLVSGLWVEEGDRVEARQPLADLDPSSVDAQMAQLRAAHDKAGRDLARLEILAADGVIPRRMLDDQRTAAAQTKAALDAAAFDRRSAKLTAPFAGFVLTRDVQRGEVVQAGQSVVTLADRDSPMLLRVPVPLSQAARMQVGDAARVTVEGATAPLTGRLVRLGRRTGVKDGAVEVEIELPPSADYRSGAIGTAEIEPRGQGRGDGAVVRIPAEAILEAEGRVASVLYVEAGRSTAHLIKVRFLGFDGDAAVVEGLPSGARVIVAGASEAAAGDLVRVVDDRAISLPSAQARP